MKGCFSVNHDSCFNDGPALHSVLMGFNGAFLVIMVQSVTIWSTQCVLYIFCKSGSNFSKFIQNSQFYQITYHLH